MDYRVSYDDDFIVHVSSQIVEDLPANVPRALLPEYMTDLILKRSRQIGKIGAHDSCYRRQFGGDLVLHDVTKSSIILYT